jgi:hypothetical protein
MIMVAASRRLGQGKSALRSKADAAGGREMRSVSRCMRRQAEREGQLQIEGLLPWQVEQLIVGCRSRPQRGIARASNCTPERGEVKDEYQQRRGGHGRHKQRQGHAA